MRLAIIALLLVSLVGCVYPFFANASAIDLVILSSAP
jgi:cytochrome c biogenesis protein ResB|tara:strand:- start:868 stop:978 length:111 start_codon:yes stop_codon:yes gene_type:complete